MLENKWSSFAYVIAKEMAEKKLINNFSFTQQKPIPNKSVRALFLIKRCIVAAVKNFEI